MSEDLNVVWFCVDTLRADHLGCYGYFRDTSPTIDRLAREGVLFPGSRANASATGPGFTSMFTGRYAINSEWYMTPYDIGDMITFPDTSPVFPERIQDHGGITTAAFDNLFQFASHMKQFVRGFEYYVNVTRMSQPLHHFVVGGAVNKRLLPWLRGHRDERFFLFVHYWDPHTPYTQPPEFARPFVHERGCLDDLVVREAPAGYRYVPGWHRVEQISSQEGPAEFHPPAEYPGWHAPSIDTYDGEVRYSDHLIGQVLDELGSLGVLDKTAIVVNADHGEQLRQHYDCWGHPGLHDGIVGTPLVLWRPGLLPGGARPEGYVHHLDIAPTILDLLGADVPGDLDGASLLPLVRGERPGRDAYYAETMGMRSVTRDAWKYIRHLRGDDELYDLTADPLEQINLLDQVPDRADALRNDLLAWVEGMLDGREDPMPTQLARMEKMRGEPIAFP